MSSSLVKPAAVVEREKERKKERERERLAAHRAPQRNRRSVVCGAVSIVSGRSSSE